MAIQESTQTVSSGWKYTAAVRIQESDLDNLEKILKRYCDQVSYEVIYKNHSTKCCNSIGEITSGNNFLDNRVLSLNICCYQGTDEIIFVHWRIFDRIVDRWNKIWNSMPI